MSSFIFNAQKILIASTPSRYIREILGIAVDKPIVRDKIIPWPTN